MASRSSLYKWKRQENKPVFSSRGNVQEWIKQVQKASDDAAKDIFGDQTPNLLSQHNVFVDDAAICEAQDLLDSWIQKKKVDDLLFECDHADEKWSHNVRDCGNVNGVESYKLAEDGSILYEPSVFNPRDLTEDFVKPALPEVNDDFDEEFAFQEIVHNMLEKDLVNIDSVSHHASYQGKTTKFKDPTPKMELRHTQVKEKANKRKIAQENATQKRISQKTVDEEARKQISKEEKEQLAKMKREEDEIRREMVKIRKAMQEENKMVEKQRMREKLDEERAGLLAKQHVLEQQKEKELKMKRENAAKAAMKRMLLDKEAKNETREKQRNLKLLHKCFSTWCTLIANNRMKMGKARALFDWRRKLRTWNSWRKYVWQMKNERESNALTQEMKERHRKEVLADRFYHQLLYQRCLAAWLSYVWKEKQKRKIKEQHDERTNKMAALLKAATTAGHSQQVVENKNHDYITNLEADSEEVEEIFLEPFKPKCREIVSVGREKKTLEKDASAREKCVRKQAWPHEILRDMKTKPTKKKRVDNPAPEVTGVTKKSPRKSRHQTEKFEDFCYIKHDSASAGSIVQKTPEILPDVGHAVSCIPQYLPVEVETRQKDEFSKVPSTARSSSSLISRESKVSSRKPSTKPLHLAMEERAKARAERKTLLEAKKKEEEIQTLAKLKKQQEQKEKELEAERQAQLQKKREERKIAKQREIEKQQRLDEIRKCNQKADDHYRHTLMKYFGFLPWKKLIKNLRNNNEQATNFYNTLLLKHCFWNWLNYTRKECENREMLAKKFLHNLLLRRYWLSWRKYRYHLVKMHQIAAMFSMRNLLKKYLRFWQDFAIEERLLFWDKENRADEHNERRLKRLCLIYWKKYIPLLKREAEHEKRREDLRKRVQALLPDFKKINLDQSQ